MEKVNALSWCAVIQNWEGNLWRILQSNC